MRGTHCKCLHLNYSSLSQHSCFGYQYQLFNNYKLVFKADIFTIKCFLFVSAFFGYAENNETIATELDVAEEEIKKVKKRFNLEDAFSDLAKRQEIFNNTKKTITDMHDKLTKDYETMCITLPEDKKALLVKELKLVEEKLVCVKNFEEKTKLVEDFCKSLQEFDFNLKTADEWMLLATKELEDIKNSSASMKPEDRVSRTMDLQEEIAGKVEIIEKQVATEMDLLPQGIIILVRST